MGAPYKHESKVFPRGSSRDSYRPQDPSFTEIFQCGKGALKKQLNFSNYTNINYDPISNDHQLPAVGTYMSKVVNYDQYLPDKVRNDAYVPHKRTFINRNGSSQLAERENLDFTKTAYQRFGELQ